MRLRSIIATDVAANRGRAHIQVFLTLFRLAQFARQRGRLGRVVAIPLCLVCRGVGLFLLSIDIPISTSVGPGLQIHHGFGIVVHNLAVLESDVVLRQGVTIGSSSKGGAPVVQAGTNIGAGAIIIGPIVLGRSSRIGAGAVVTHDVPAGVTVAGNPARILSGAGASSSKESV